MDERTIKRQVQAQFGAAAQGYVSASIFAQGDDLQRLVALAQPNGDERVLDIATGGGHTALAFAPHVSEVIATDLTAPMLQAAEAHARERGVSNVRFQWADAEDLPFPDASFDLVTTRIAPHHFPNPQRYVNEVARVLRPGGRFLLNDSMVPDDPELDAFMNRFEQWRDPSHVRAHTCTTWYAWVEQAGLIIDYREPLSFKSLDFAQWTARMNMPDADRAALEAWLIAAPPRCAEFFGVRVEAGQVRELRCTFSLLVAHRPV